MTGWGEYGLAWACFLAAHLVPAMPGLRAVLVAWLGRRGYLAAFSLLSVVLLVWLLRAAGAAPVVPLWDLGSPGRWLFNLAMPAAILIGAMAAGLSGLLAGFAIWAAAHLVANGDLSHVILFGGMLIFALGGLLRSGWPQGFRVTPLRCLLAMGLWAGLMTLHPLVVGVSPYPG